MKAIVCELCESRDVIKQDGFFVCQNCGTRYTTEDAKKLMKEVGEAAGSGKTLIDKHLQNARRAMSKEDWEEVEKYYNKVEEIDPDNIEAVFYSAYGKAKASLRENDIYKRQSIFKTLSNSVAIIAENFNVEDVEGQKEIIEKITADVLGMFGSSFVYTETKNGYGNVTGDNKSETYQLFCTLGANMDSTLKAVYDKIPDDKKSKAAYVLQSRLKLCDYAINSSIYSSGAKDAWATAADSVVAAMKKIDPNFRGKSYGAIRAEQKAAEEEANKKAAVGCLIGAVVFIVAMVIIIVAIMS